MEGEKVKPNRVKHKPRKVEVKAENFFLEAYIPFITSFETTCTAKHFSEIQ